MARLAAPPAARAAVPEFTAVALSRDALPSHVGGRARLYKVRAADPQQLLKEGLLAATAPHTYNPTAMPLTQNDRKQLRRLGHALQPVVMIGQHGLTRGIVAEMDGALTAHELVKVKARVGGRTLRWEVLSRLAEETGAELVHTIGNTGLYYRKNNKLQTILLPDS